MAWVDFDRLPEGLLRFGRFSLNQIDLGQIVQGIGIGRLQLERMAEGIDSLSWLLLFEINHAEQMMRLS